MQLRDQSLFRQKCYVDGAWVDADGGATVPVNDPATQEILGNVPRMGANETRRAIEAAERALPGWRARTAKERAKILRKWADLMMENQEDLAVLMTAEQGKPLAESRGEIAYAASFLEWFAEEGKRVYGDTIPATACTSRRLAQTQVCPVLRYLLAMAPATAASRSASSKTMNGALPPSSSDTFFTVEAHCSMSCLPISVEPVKVTLRTTGFVVSSRPMGPEEPVTTLKIPLGIPARSPSSASASAENGVALAGLRTTGQPLASAGPALRVIIAEGKFQGVIAATTPTGSFTTTIRLSRAWDGMVSP